MLNDKGKNASKKKNKNIFLFIYFDLIYAKRHKYGNETYMIFVRAELTN